ncbi:MFS general substrate transporter [Xylariomycetidae sp. FL2044]|nr:MFS general substrate transporter [Xylariomycetidae sp. FL2044]
MAEDNNMVSLPSGEIPNPRATRGARFWGIFAALCLLAFISALDASIISTALPTITAAIGGSTQYVWIANSFVLASSVLQPLFGQLADIYGRQTPLAISVIIFALGSGIGGGASNVSMLIAGRTVQGIGAGGIYVLIDIVCCDLVPLRERGKYLALLFSWAGIGGALGPPVGGAIAEVDWRWVFWINLPICGIALATLLLSMKVNVGSGRMTQATKTKLMTVDYLGTLIFIPSVFGVLFGLIMGGMAYAWSSWRVILPLVLGFLGCVVFLVQQRFWATNPSVPSRLFSNRTSATAYGLTFLSSILAQSLIYFLPVYFQGVLGTSVLDSGTFFLPYAIGSLSSAVLGGVLLSKFGVYRSLHAAAFAISAVGFGLLTMLDAQTTKVAWVFFQLIAAAGTGVPLSVMLPAIMAGLPETDVAAATAAYSFVRNFGLVWGVTVPGIVFNAATEDNIYLISDVQVQDALRDGSAYSFASRLHGLRDTFDPVLWSQVTQVYAKSLRAVWWFGLGISIVCFFAVGGEKPLELRRELDTEYGLEDAASNGATTA